MEYRNVLLTSAATVLLIGSGLACSIDGTGRDPFTPPDDTTTPYLPELPEDSKRLVLLHTNDEHSHLLGFGPTSIYPFLPSFDGSFSNGSWSVDDAQTEAEIQHALTYHTDSETMGGIVRRQFLINRERTRAAAVNDPVLLLSAGDVMMGTIFHATYAAGQAPDYLAMALLGYDYIAMGNHEFDFGTEVLADAIEAAQQLVFGGAPPILAANMHFDDVGAPHSEDPAPAGWRLKNMVGAGDSGAPIMPWSTKVLSNGLRVGIFGMVGFDAALKAPGKSPIAFSTPDGPWCGSSNACDAGLSCARRHCINPLDVDSHLEALAEDAQDVIDTLRLYEEVDVVIALTHLGMDEDSYLATHTTGIDVIIGGHSHDEIRPTLVGETIIVQAGDYGRKLGKLTLNIDLEGQITYDPAGSLLIPVDHTVDTLMRTDTDELGAAETAATFTASIIGSLVGGLNEALLGPLVNDVLGVQTTSIFDPLDIVTCSHDIVGEVAHQDSNLIHLATDAILQQVSAKKCCLPSYPMVAVQANGVVRETLRFSSSTNNRTTLADIFRVLPLGASPWEGDNAAPGYPILLFTLTPHEVLQGLEIGVTRGLESDAFFLSYSGMRTQYDRNRPDFDPDAADPYATGHIVKIEVEQTPMAGDYFTLYDARAAEPWQDENGTPIDPTDPSDYRLIILTNLYIAAFLDTFGLAPRDEDGDIIGDLAEDELMDRLADTALCIQPMVPLWSVQYCQTLDLGGPPWDLLPELKGWESLVMYLDELSTISQGEYAGATVATDDLRVTDVTQ
ncbi:bifunctional metallophosphatase/5'-nucleotidase [Myxococcota bacterium]